MRALKQGPQRPPFSRGCGRTTLIVLGQGVESLRPTSGAVRRVYKQRKSKLICQDMIENVCQRGKHITEAFRLLEQAQASNPGSKSKADPGNNQGSPDDIYIRFPSLEFRSLVLNPLAKSGLMQPFPDRAVWNKHKVELAQLVLQLASNNGSAYAEGLQRMVEFSMERDSYALQRMLADDQVVSEEKERQRRKLEIRKNRVRAEFDRWCRSTINNPHFHILKPVLQQVLQVEPALPIDNRRDGSRTEAVISALIERELPPGWSMYTQCRIVGVDGEAFKNEKALKGEADVLLADAQGIVQAVLEVKTARGNPYLALYEDLQRFRNMTERVRGRLVAFTPALPSGFSLASVHHGHHHHPPGSTSTAPISIISDLNSSCGNGGVDLARSAALPAAPITGAVPGGVPSLHGGSISGGGDGAPLVVTLRFSKNVKPIYVLGSAIYPEEVDAVVRSAQSKLLTMELGRVLSTQIDAWKDVSLVEITREAAIVQVPQSSFPQCESNVRDYFKRLEACHVYMVQTP